MKKKAKANEYRIMGDPNNFMIAKPVYDKKTGEFKRYVPFKFYPKIEQCLARMYDYLVEDEFPKEAMDVKTLIDLFSAGRETFVNEAHNVVLKSE